MSRTHFRFHWPATPDAAASARRTVELLPLSTDRDRFDDLRLLLSEAIAGVVHGSGTQPPGELDLRVSVAEHDLRAEVVLERGSSVPAASVQPPELSGWGMLLVDHVASSWGVLQEPGSGLWFELPVGYRRRRNRSASRSEAAA